MASPILETKLHAPTVQPRRVARERLLDRVRRGLEGALTLVSAPAGFGKSTLMAQAVAAAASNGSAGRSVGWLSLDPGDNDPVTFWTYVVNAMDRAVPGVGRAALSQLDVAGGGSPESAIASLVNALASSDEEVVLVLDDLHVVEQPAIHQQLMYLLDHLPAHAHLVAGTRADPPIPLARLRARGALVEVRATDLRFTPDEASAYLTGSMGLVLDAANVAALESRTEGWIAALQLAALSMQGRDDLAGFIDRFAGDDRYIVDYLVEEVLTRQPEAVRAFLLETSILARMTGTLVDSVTGQRGGRATLEALDRGNLFVVALDDQRQWYRYHHLFGDVLQAHLAAERPDDVAVLHRRASDWFESSGDRAEAIRHALAGKDVDRAAALIERSIPEMRRTRREPTLIRWFDALPDEAFDTRPILAVGYAGVLLSDGRADRVAELLGRADRWLAVAPGSDRPDGMVVADEWQLRLMPAMVELYRAALAKLGGDLEGNITHARRALELLDPADDVGRGGADAFLGLAYWELGQLDLALRSYRDGMASLDRSGFHADVVGGALTTADILLAQGHLREVAATYEASLDRATRGGPPFLRGVADMHAGLGAVAYERGDLAEAVTQLDTAEQLGEEHAFPRFPHRSRVARAWLAAATGDVERALELLTEAEDRYVPDFQPDVRPIAAQRARLLVAHGRVAEARASARRRGVAPTDEPTYLREYELLTLARLLTAEDSTAEAVALSGRLVEAAEEGNRGGSLLEALVVDALARHAAADVGGALAALDRAAALAEPEGFVRTFLDEGPAMTTLLKVAVKRADAPAYLATLLTAARSATARRSPTTQGLIEPLSDRELEVLRLLRSELDGPAIANELVVSLNTLRTHTKNIYAKLGVTSRRSAVRRGEELDLF
jgi:LuxR family maltose regulon positive regulatory protein